MEKRIITWLRGRICTAFIQDGSLVELTLEDEDCSVLNRIYVGRVQKVVPGINAAFIDTGDGVGYYSLTENRSHLFTDRNRKEGPLRQGDEILVQISREGVKTKAPVLTANLSLPGRLCVVTAGRTGIGFSNKISDSLFKKGSKGLSGGSSLKWVWRDRTDECLPGRYGCAYKRMYPFKRTSGSLNKRRGLQSERFLPVPASAVLYYRGAGCL